MPDNNSTRGEPRFSEATLVGTHSVGSSAITQKVWSMCGVLYDDGVSYGDYLEQLTYLIFLKMADEYSKPPFQTTSSYCWCWFVVIFLTPTQS